MYCRPSIDGIYRVLKRVLTIGRKRGRRQDRSRAYQPQHSCLKAIEKSSVNTRETCNDVERTARQRAFHHDTTTLIPRHTRYNIGFDSLLKKTQPVHETLTLAALTLADPDQWSHTSYASAPASTWEFFRGIMWNDDPCCDLFDDTPSRNNALSNGLAFGAHFALGKAEADLALALGWSLDDMRNGPLTGRSHFYDLQFLHSMAMHPGEEPRVTRAKILLWCQVMYRLAVGDGVDGSMRIEDVPVELDGHRLKDFFDEHTSVRVGDTLFSLITHGTCYRDVKIEHRALGSLLHVIQDSYARGHARRENTSDDSDDNAGDVVNFHCYLGQDATKHAHFDDLDVSTVSIGDLDSFDAIPGAKAAIRACAQVVRFWQAEVPWTGEVESFLGDTVFKCATGVTPSNTDI